jgi:hypothetical protein
MQVDDGWDAFEENVEDLHELEFKSHKIQNATGFIHPVRQENIIKLIQEKAWDYFTTLRNSVVGAFQSWNSEHQIKDAETWSAMVFREVAEYYMEGETVEGIMRDGILWGSIRLDPKDISQYVDPNLVKASIKEDFDYSPEDYEDQIEYWLDTTKPEWKQSGEEAVQYLQDNMMEDNFIQNYLSELDVSSYVSDYEATHMIMIDEYTIMRAIAHEMYPQYMARYGDDIKGIKANIQQAIKGLRQVNRDTPISKMVESISIALNVMHVNGNICQDKLDYSDTFLEHMSNVDTSEWEQEVTEEFAV